MKALFEKMFSRWLALDPESPRRLATLSGKVVGVCLKGTPLHFQLVFGEGEVSFRWEDFLPEDVSVTGTPLRLLQLRFSRNRQAFFAEDVSVTGDLTLAREVMALFDEWQPDWEEWASQWMGDVLAHEAGRFLRATRRKARETGRRLRENLGEYLQEELAVSPPREAVKDFLQEVDALRLQVDRLEARMERLRAKT